MKSRNSLLAFLSALVLSISIGACAVHTAPAPKPPKQEGASIQASAATLPSSDQSTTTLPKRTHSSVYTKQSKNYCSTCPRDSHGRIKRSAKAKHEFMRVTGYPHGRPGYIIDHIIPLKEGGADAPSNMQWQTIEEAKAKDRWE